jgi:predicted  nucleic acid-binding Zn-ribbon protein
VSGYRPRDNTLATALDRIEDLREAVQAQTQAMHTLIDSLRDLAARMDRIEQALIPEGSGDNRVEELLSRIVAILESNADAMHAIRTMLLRLPEEVAGAVRC